MYVLDGRGWNSRRDGLCRRHERPPKCVFMEQNVQQLTFSRDKINTQGFLLLDRMMGLSMILEGGIQIELVGLARSDTIEEHTNTV